ncbi:hypothetical protein C1645_790779 [Glomus cerebriforme]|uniref:Uncharacterized protein n=1 Tax=Glomus cerebriforme TaxID=658196 RepID=A0A397S5J1_9GLOM|nr:hypothetical protein C1645_790779 [Glomus cerebriforme]
MIPSPNVKYYMIKTKSYTTSDLQNTNIQIIIIILQLSFLYFTMKSSLLPSLLIIPIIFTLILTTHLIIPIISTLIPTMHLLLFKLFLSFLFICPKRS